MSSINPIEPIDSIDDSKSGQELILLADIQKDIRELQNGVKEVCAHRYIVFDFVG